MKYLLLLIILSTLSSTLLAATEETKMEICTIFAKDNSGRYELDNYSEGPSVEIYKFDNVFNYCLNAINPQLLNDHLGQYYEFELFICGQVYQDEIIAYDPKTGKLENLGGSGSGSECPYL